MIRRLKWKIVRVAVTWLYLMIGWVVFTWSLNPVSVAGGAVFSLAIAWFTYGLFIAGHEAERRSIVPRIHLLVIFAVILLWSIYSASIRVAVSMITGRINPRIVHFRTRLKSDLGRTILANSITVTPGTICVELDEDHLIVHWLNAKTTHSRYAGRLIKGALEHWLLRIWV